ncbi:MAG: glycoside hydrolase family 5 protein, partial [Ekhidna sp.]
MKVLITFLCTICILFGGVAQTPVETHGALSVMGNQIVNKDGQAVSFAGNSLFWSNTGWGGEDFYKPAVVEWLHADWNTTIVRAAMGVDENGGYLSDASNSQKVKTVVDAAIDLGIYVIIDWHSHHAEDYEEEAIAFFEEMATLYGDNEHVIYEIYNEPLNTTSWSNSIKPYAEAVIAAIRAIDNDNLIIVGTSTWSQDVDIASNNPIMGYSNIAYTLHFYAGTHGQSLRNKAQVALNNGIALMVTEWGAVNANGDGSVDASETQLWMDFLQENNISHCNWALNDKNEGASALRPGSNTNGNWSANDLTTSGNMVRNIVYNWDRDPNLITGVGADTEAFSFKLYPNPARGVTYLSLSNNQQILS